MGLKSSTAASHQGTIQFWQFPVINDVLAKSEKQRRCTVLMFLTWSSRIPTAPPTWCWTPGQWASVWTSWWRSGPQAASKHHCCRDTPRRWTTTWWRPRGSPRYHGDLLSTLSSRTFPTLSEMDPGGGKKVHGITVSQQPFQPIISQHLTVNHYSAVFLSRSLTDCCNWITF